MSFILLREKMYVRVYTCVRTEHNNKLIVSILPFLLVYVFPYCNVITEHKHTHAHTVKYVSHTYTPIQRISGLCVLLRSLFLLAYCAFTNLRLKMEYRKNIMRSLFGYVLYENSFVYCFVYLLWGVLRYYEYVKQNNMGRKKNKIENMKRNEA